MSSIHTYRTWTWHDGHRASELALTADNGTLTLAIGPDGQPPIAQHTLTLHELDALAAHLPALREWVTSGQPRHHP